MSHQIGTVFHAKEMSQILVLFILCDSSGRITLVWNYCVEARPSLLSLQVGAFHLTLTTPLFLQYFCNVSHLSYEKYGQDQTIQDTVSQKCRVVWNNWPKATEVDFLCFASEFQKDGFLNVYKLRHICMSDINQTTTF